jgi:hypothetical protein
MSGCGELILVRAIGVSSWIVGELPHRDGRVQVADGR